MSGSVRKVERNFIKNPKFVDDWTDGWKLIDNASGVSNQDDNGITCVFLVKKGAIKQTFKLASRPDADARYMFSFSYQLNGNKRCMVCVKNESGDLLHEISFGKDLDDSSHVEVETEPLLIDWLHYPPELLDLERTDREVTIELVGPNGGLVEGFYVTNLRVELFLDPLQLQEIKFDDQLKNADKALLFFCHGATHTIVVTPVVDSPWAGQGISLDGENEVPPAGITTTPALGDFQPFDPLGATWSILCDPNGADALYTLWVQTEFTGEPYAIPVSLGHHRVKIGETRPPIEFPVMNDSVKCGVRVKSIYTDDWIEGIGVKWTVDGESYHESTDEKGLSEFVYKTTQAGIKEITAQITNRYDDSCVEESFIIDVLEKSPWEDVELYMNDQLVTVSSLWGVFCFRGKENIFALKAPSLEGREVVLRYVEVDELTMDADPVFDKPEIVRDGKLKWSLTPGSNKSGHFRLYVECPDIETPLGLPGHVIAENFDEEVRVTIGEVDVSPDVNFFSRGKSHDFMLDFKPGSPLKGYPFTLLCKVDGELSPEDVTSFPPFSESNEDSEIWTITGSAIKSGTFQLDLVAHWQKTSLLDLRCMLLSSNLLEEVTPLVDGKSVPAGDLFFTRDTTRIITLTPLPGSPAGELKVALKCYPINGLAPEEIVSVPPLMEPTTSGSWTVQSPNNATGTFSIELLLPWFSPIQVGRGRKFRTWYEINGESFVVENGMASKVIEPGKDVYLDGFYSPEIDGAEVRATSLGVMVVPAMPHVFEAVSGKRFTVKLYSGSKGWIRFDFSKFGLDGYSETIELSSSR